MADRKEFSARRKFSTFVEEKSAIGDYEKNNFVNLYVKDSMTKASALKHTPNK